MKTLAERLVACRRFRRMLGMRLRCMDDPQRSGVVGAVLADGRVVLCIESMSTWVWPENWLPDLEDPATLGCVLALVREAYHESTIHTVGWFSEWDDQVMWHVVSGKEDRGLATEETEAEALVAALEAA